MIKYYCVFFCCRLEVAWDVDGWMVDGSPMQERQGKKKERGKMAKNCPCFCLFTTLETDNTSKTRGDMRRDSPNKGNYTMNEYGSPWSKPGPLFLCVVLFRNLTSSNPTATSKIQIATPRKTHQNTCNSWAHLFLMICTFLSLIYFYLNCSFHNVTLALASFTT